VELFPTQPPNFITIPVLANNQLKAIQKAKDMLEMGLDYLVNNRSLESILTSTGRNL
jgi:tRNA-dihydrouridine synthase